MVFWKAVREAEREPSAAGLRMEEALGESVEPAVAREGEERFERSLRMVVLCLRARLKVVFCAWSAFVVQLARCCWVG